MAGMKETYRAIFGEELKKESYKMIGHSFRLNSRIGKSVCDNCGLVALRNDFTNWSVRMGCMASDHTQYESARKRYSAFIG
jgi:hypothetical protein